MKAMESAWFRFEEEAEHMEAASTATTLLRRSSRLSTEVRHRTEERCFSTLGSATSSPFFFRGSGAGGGLGGGRFEMQARVRRDEAGPLTSPVGGGRVTGVGGEGGVVGGSGRFPAFPRGVDAAADIASRRTEFAQRFGMFTRPNAKEPANLSSANELDEVKKDLRNAREENLKLQAVITDVTEVNKRWQKYNNDRQMYVDKLLSTIQNQQEQMNTNIEKRLQMSKEGDDSIDLTRQLHAENAKLRDEVGQLKRRMESMEREHKEHVEVLEIQVKANKDDWEAEKREKELARQEKEKLEKLAQELQEEINLLKLKYSCHHSTMGQRRPSSCGSAGCHFIYGEDGRESHCSSHITICRKNSFPAHRTSMHVPCASGHLIPRGSLVYLDDDLVIDGDSEKIKPALELNVPIQLRSRSNSMEDIMSPPNEEKKPFSESEVKGDLNRFKDSAAESVEKCVLDIPSTNGVTQSRSASTFSSASSLSLASGGCRLEGSLLNIKDMAASSSSNSLVSSSAKALPPLPTSYSDTVVPDQVHKPALDSRWSTRISASPFKININNIEATNVVDVNLQSSSTMLPNIAAEPSFEECPEDGVLTQTREDVICPGCGRVFHPEIHLQFLKHFGECQSKNKANKSTLKSRN